MKLTPCWQRWWHICVGKRFRHCSAFNFFQTTFIKEARLFYKCSKLFWFVKLSNLFVKIGEIETGSKISSISWHFEKLSNRRRKNKYFVFPKEQKLFSLIFFWNVFLWNITTFDRTVQLWSLIKAAANVSTTMFVFWTLNWTLRPERNIFSFSRFGDNLVQTK
jgi:hypothetical protein